MVIDWRNRIRRPRLAILLAVLGVVVAGYAVFFFMERHKFNLLLTDGKAMLAAREYATASELLERYLVGRPADTGARLLAARAARQTRAYADARGHLRRCLADGGESEAIAVEEKLLAVLQGDEGPVGGLRQRAKLDDDLALVILEVLVQHDLNTYQLGAALEGFTRYLTHRPDDLHALLGRAFVWERFMSFADALEDYRKAVAAHPASERARLKLADSLLVVGTPEEALIHYRWLDEHGAGHPPVRLGLARCYRRLAEVEKANALLDGLVAEFPNHGETLWELGELNLEQGRLLVAEPLLRKAAALRPFDRRVHYGLYRCFLQQDRAAEAAVVDARVKQIDADMASLNAIRAAVIKEPDNADLRCEGGLIFLRHGEHEEGQRWLRLALRLDPQCEKARAALATEANRPPTPGASR